MFKMFSLVALLCVISVIGVPSHGTDLNLPGKIVTITFTPFDDNGRVNLEIVPKMPKYYADNNLKNILIIGCDGVGALLLEKERKALVAAWVQQGCSLGLNIIVEVGLQPFVATLSLASYCSKQNVSAIAHFPEQVYKAQTIEEAVGDLRRISEVSPNLPLIYSELLLTAPEISTDEVFLAGDEVPTFAGVETTMNTYWDIKAVTSIGNKTILIYDSQYMYAAFLQGLTSLSLGPNFSPRIVKAMEAAANNGDRTTARKLQNELNRLFAAITVLDGDTINTNSRGFYASVKAAFQLITCINVGARVPLVKADSNTYQRIASNLRSLGLSLPDCASQSIKNVT